MINWVTISFLLLSYVIFYFLTHIPFDILMLVKKNKASYPRPDFKSAIEGILVVIPTLGFWFFLVIAPIIAFSKQTNIYTMLFHNSSIGLVIQVIGIIILFTGVFLAGLGRIGRGLYLAKEKATLCTTWGHAIVRHPEYFMYITGFIGLPMVTLNLWTLFFLPGIIGYILAAKYEEESLIDQFGDEYRKYMDSVGRFYPKFKRNI